MQFLNSMKKAVDAILNAFMVVTFIVIFCVVLIQIFHRYVLNSPLVWTEELSRYIFVWVSLCGWVLATRSGTHIRITFIEERLPPAAQKVLKFAFRLCTLGFLAGLAWLGYSMASRTFGRSAVTLPMIPMGIVYGALPVSAVLSMFYVVHDLLAPALAKDDPAVLQ